MRRVLTLVAAIVVATPVTLTVGVAGAGADDGTFLAFGQTLRRCDYSANTHIGPTGQGHPTATVREAGSDVVADVQMVRAIPNTPYDVKVIELPRSSAAGCGAGDPGVVGGVLVTDAAGAGGVSLRGPIVSGASGVWLFISRPNEFSQMPAEFYSSDFVAPL